MEAEPKFALTELVLDRVDLVTAGANPGARVLIHKFEAPVTLEVDMADGTVETPEVQKVEEKVAQEETVAKADFEALQKQLADVNKALVDAENARKADAERIAKMERDRKHGEFIAKAKDLGNLSKSADALGTMLLDISEKVDEGTFKQLEQLLNAANEQLAKGALFATFGHGGAEPPVEKSVEDKVEVLAKALVAEGKAPTLQVAKQMVMVSNKELQAEYIRARAL